MRHRPSDAAAIAAAQEAERNPATIGSAVAGQKTAEAAEALGIDDVIFVDTDGTKLVAADYGGKIYTKG